MHIISHVKRDLWSPGRWCLDLLPAPSIRNVKSNVYMAAAFQLMKRGSVPPFQFSILSSASRAAPMRGAMAGDVTPSNILLIGGYRGHWSGSGLDPESHAYWFSLTCAYASGQSGSRITSPESFTTGCRFQSFGLNWTWEKSSRPIRHLKLLLKSINIQPGSDILPNNLSSLANPLSSFCSTQFSTEQSTTETKLTYNTEFLYAFTCTSGNANDITDPYTTVTNSLIPWTRASESIRIITARSVSKGMPQYFLHSPAPVATLSSPVILLFCCKRYWSKRILQSFIFLNEAVSNYALISRLAP